MKRNEIKPGDIYAVVTGSMYEGAENSAEPAIVVEVGVAVDNFNHGRHLWSNRPSSTTTDGVRVQLLDRKTLEPRRTDDGFQTRVVKTRNVVALWEEHTARMQARKEREEATAQRAKDSQAALESWVERLGLRGTWELPNLSGGIGGSGWDSEYTRNRAALARVLQAAYDLGRKDAGA